MKTDLATSHVAVTPGQQARVQIAVTNTADVIDGITAIVDGINPDWIRLEQPVMSLFPEASGQLELVFDIPTTCPAGDYLVVARIVSTIDAERQTVHDFWLNVATVPALDLGVRPQIVTGGKLGTFTAAVLNTGNAPCDVMVTVEEPTREVDCDVETGIVLIPQGHEALIDVDLRGPRPWFGQPETRKIIVTAATDEIAVEEFVTFNQKPRIPRGLITFLILAAIVLLWAGIFYVIVDQLQSGEDAKKAVATNQLQGEKNVPLAAIAVTVEGQVTASTTGKGIPRITVEARRRTTSGAFEPVASVATDEDGLYAFESLLPGTYEFRFNGEGYPATWYPGVRKEKNAEQKELQPQERVNNVNIELKGQQGSLSGTVRLPSGGSSSSGSGFAQAGQDTGLEATASQVAQQAGQKTPKPKSAPVLATDNPAIGQYTISGLQTPATFTVTIAGENFETQQFGATLTGGEASNLNAVNVAAAPGTITGSVVDEAGIPLGGVDVLALGGEEEYATVTPTSGRVGEFTIPNLPTPEIYVVAFTKDGYSGETRTLDLTPGSPGELNSVQLVRGSGTITGSAVSGGFPLGNIDVVVLGDEVRAQTTTLTSDGSFVVSDLPVPGTYSVTLDSIDYQPETNTIIFDASAPSDFSAPRSIGAVEMVPATATLSGTVRDQAGSGLGEVSVTLSNGVLEADRTTTSASAPSPGSYTFTGVPEGSYTVTFERDGYVTQVVLTTVAAGIDPPPVNATLKAS